MVFPSTAKAPFVVGQELKLSSGNGDYRLTANVVVTIPGLACSEVRIIEILDKGGENKTQDEDLQVVSNEELHTLM